MRQYQSYTNPPYRPENVALKWIIILNVAAFILQNVFTVWFNAPIMNQYLALSSAKLMSGYIWTVVTYSFLHRDFFHILVNILAIFFAGRIVEPMFGPKRFIQAYIGASIIGGLLWMVLNPGDRDILVGASASGFGLITLFCLSQPNQPITFLIFLIIPVTLKPKWLLTSLIVIEVFLFLFHEFPRRSVVASSAHLGGILGGFIAYRLFATMSYSGLRNIKIETPQWVKNKVIHKTYSPKYKVNVSNTDALKQEIDRILDKINSQGFGSLSEEEKKTLDRAKDILNR